jgi:hypothetical protein
MGTPTKYPLSLGLICAANFTPGMQGFKKLSINTPGDRPAGDTTSIKGGSFLGCCTGQCLPYLLPFLQVKLYGFKT